MARAVLFFALLLGMIHISLAVSVHIDKTCAWEPDGHVGAASAAIFPQGCNRG